MSIKNVINNKLFLGITLFFLILFCHSQSFGATYYVDGSLANDSGSGSLANPKQIISSGIALMQGGDTLIIKDGTYTGDDNRIRRVPSGSLGNYTTIKAENDFGVILSGLTTGSGANNEEAAIGLYQKSYVTIEGFIVKDSVGTSKYATSGISLYSCDHCRIMKIGIKNGVTLAAEYGGGIVFDSCNYCLIEDVFVAGMARYSVQVSRGSSSHHNIVRRAVVRWDYCTTAQPRASIVVYGGTDGTVNNEILLQNNIVIDGNDGLIGNFSGGFTATHDVSNVKRVGCISINNIGWGFHSSEDPLSHDNTNTHCVAWDTNGAVWREEANGVSGAYNCTFSSANAGSQRWRFDGAGIVEAKDSLFYQCASPNIGLDNQDGNVYYPADEPSQMGNNYSTADPNFEYIVRSPVNGKGATIEYKIGVTGTLYGESGYDTLTMEPLWPWPHEDKIKELFSETNDPPGGYGLSPATNNTLRGFCATGNDSFGKPMTLTRYIWQYLGNEIPAEIYEITTDTSPPEAPTGLEVL